MQKLLKTPPEGWLQAVLIYYDCETTGVTPLSSVYMVELAAEVDIGFMKTYFPAVDLDTKPLGWSSLLRAPPGTMTAGALACHHIEESELVNYETFVVTGRLFFQWLELWRRHAQVPYVLLVAHNGAKFDQPLLLQEFARAYPTEVFPDWIVFADTLVCFQEQPWCLTYGTLSMKAISEKILLKGTYTIQDHRAASDVRLLATIVANFRHVHLVYKWLFKQANISKIKSN